MEYRTEEAIERTKMEQENYEKGRIPQLNDWQYDPERNPDYPFVRLYNVNLINELVPGDEGHPQKKNGEPK